MEYDHVEVARLLLACGADPMLSKFSGRAIRDMIHGSAMKSFLTGEPCGKFNSVKTAIQGWLIQSSLSQGVPLLDMLYFISFIVSENLALSSHCCSLLKKSFIEDKIF